MKRTWSAGLAVLALALATPAEAGKVKVWQHKSPADHEKADCKGVVLDNRGTLSLSRRLVPLANLDVAHVWCVHEDRAGNLYAGTGEDGKVFRVSVDGTVRQVMASETGQVLCLAEGSQGMVAGTGPGGTILQVDTGKVLATLPESYIWALAADPKSQSLYAATGPHGRVYRVGADGKATVFYETGQDHVLCLAVAPDGTVYAGTDKTGRVYRINQAGKGEVLFQAAQSEVKTLLLARDALYAGTSATRKRPGSGAVKAGSSSISTTRLDRPAAVKVSTTEPIATTKTTDSKSKEPARGTAAAAPEPPATGENSVYRISFDGMVREVFRDKVLVLSLGRLGDRLLVGTGMKGQLFEVDEATGTRMALARLDHGQLLGICARKNGSLVVAAGDPGKLYSLTDRYVEQGTIISEVLDAKLPGRWGSLTVRGNTPAGTRLSLATRSGNVADPDATWTAWTSELTDLEEAKNPASPARYLQYRLTLTSETGKTTPTVGSLALRYATGNQAPEVTRVEVPNLAATAKSSKKIDFKWTATDANEDELSYRLLVKKDGWTDWVQIEDELASTEYEWDTTTAPSGVYRLRVIASDRPDNPSGHARTAERTSEPFTICHTPPVVKLTPRGVEKRCMKIEVHGQSPLVRLVSASYAVDGKKWVSLFPEDELFDSKQEQFRLTTEQLEPGAHVLVVRVKDAAGNVGSADLVFVVK